MGKKIKSIGEDRARDEIANEVVALRNKIEGGAGTLGRGRALTLILELLLDIRDELVQVKNKL